MTETPALYLVVELDAAPDVEDAPMPELRIDGEVVHPESVVDRTITYLFADGAVGTPQLRLADELVGPNLLRPLITRSLLDAVPLRVEYPFAGPNTGLPPQASTFPTRVSYSEEKDVPRPGLATSPPAPPPINGVATMSVSTFLDSDHELRTTTDWEQGWLLEYETYCEPLGWALDEWIDTTSLAPFEDAIRSSADVHNVNRASQDAHTAAAEAANAVLAGQSAVNESTQLSTQQQLRTRQFDLSASPAETATAAANPLAKIIQSLTGTLQVGFSASSARTSAQARGDLARVLNNQVEQATSRARSINARALADLEGTTSEDRRLSALQNLGGNRALNLASFSLARQWKVSTVEARKRRVIFVRIKDLDKPIDAEEVFVHRAILAASLLDLEMQETLKLCAAQWRPALPAKPQEATIAPDLIVRQARIRFGVANPAKGRDARVTVTGRFRNAIGPDLEFDESRDASERHVSHEFAIQINQPLRRLSAWSVLFESEAIFFRDWRAHLSNFTIDLDLEDGDHQPSTLRVDIPSEIALDLDDRRHFRRGVPDLPRTNPGREPETDLNLTRLLTHLNANRSYYRSAIDLQRDPVARFIDFSARAPIDRMPADMRPVGVAGAHLAYLATPDAEPVINGASICQLVATPAFGLFQEVVQGTGTVTVEQNGKPWPSVRLRDKESIPWPPSIQVTTLSATPASLDGAAAAATEKPAEVGPGELAAKLQKLQDTVTALADKLKPKDEEKEEEEPAEPESEGT